MKTRTNIHAGDALRHCQRERDYWKAQAERMEAIAKGPGPYRPPAPTPTPSPVPHPGGGWVGGVWYPDRSGWCG